MSVDASCVSCRLLYKKNAIKRALLASQILSNSIIFGIEGALKRRHMAKKIALNATTPVDFAAAGLVEKNTIGFWCGKLVR